jgi:hypothetical protein
MTMGTLRYARYLLAALSSIAFVFDFPITAN